jgi:hypothetical protein
MGVRNVSAGLLTAADKLSDGARITLLTLCLLSYDTPQHGVDARTYFGGWQMAMIRQGAYPDNASKRRFMRHIAELRAQGIVEVMSAGYHGSRAVYRLVLAVDNLPESVDNDS